MTHLTASDIARCAAIGGRMGLVAQIVTEVAEATGQSERAIYGRSCVREATLARQLVMFRAAELGLSSTRIGRALGRDHSTVLHGVKAERARREGMA